MHDRAPINALLVRDDTKEEFPISKEVVRLGRSRGNDLRFDSPQASVPGQKHLYSSISRRQAAIALQNNTFFITNMSSKNPTQLNGRALDIPPGQDRSPAATLAAGSKIRMGAVTFTFYPEASAYAPPAVNQQ